MADGVPVAGSVPLGTSAPASSSTIDGVPIGAATFVVEVPNDGGPVPN